VNGQHTPFPLRSSASPPEAGFGSQSVPRTSVRGQISRRLSKAQAIAAFTAVFTLASSPRSEVVDLHTRTTYYREGSPYGNMTVWNPAVSLSVKPWESFGVTGGYAADVVSGASVKTRNGTRGQPVDAITTASVKDTRHAVNGGFAFTRKQSTLTAGYSHSFENDYKSHSVDVAGKAELLQKTVELSIAYSHNWDSVCDRIQIDNDPTRRLSLDNSKECFKPSTVVTTRPIAVDAIQAGYTQLWSPTFATQLTGSIQIQHGFLSNPYREVNIGVSSPAQEYVPDVRARLAAGLRANWYLKPLKTAMRLGGKVYRDTWDVRALSGEMELERYILIDALRVRLRGRYYTQQHAAFYSDDYLIEPRGVYFTGDRELSTMRTILAGGRLAYGPSATNGRWLGILQKVEVSLGVDYMWFKYDDFTIAGTPLAKQAFIGTFGLSLVF